MAAIEIGQILQDFSVIMIVAGAMAMLSYRFKQPMVIGYIGAGMIIGPHTPPFSLVLNLDVLNLFAEIGIVLLLFVVGMEFPIEKLRKIGKKDSLLLYLKRQGRLSQAILWDSMLWAFHFLTVCF